MTFMYVIIQIRKRCRTETVVHEFIRARSRQRARRAVETHRVSSIGIKSWTGDRLGWCRIVVTLLSRLKRKKVDKRKQQGSNTSATRTQSIMDSPTPMPAALQAFAQILMVGGNCCFFVGRSSQSFHGACVQQCGILLHPLMVCFCHMRWNHESYYTM